MVLPRDYYLDCCYTHYINFTHSAGTPGGNFVEGVYYLKVDFKGIPAIANCWKAFELYFLVLS